VTRSALRRAVESGWHSHQERDRPSSPSSHSSELWCPMLIPTARITQHFRTQGRRCPSREVSVHSSNCRARPTERRWQRSSGHDRSLACGRFAGNLARAEDGGVVVAVGPIARERAVHHMDAAPSRRTRRAPRRRQLASHEGTRHREMSVRAAHGLSTCHRYMPSRRALVSSCRT